MSEARHLPGRALVSLHFHNPGLGAPRRPDHRALRRRLDPPDRVDLPPQRQRPESTAQTPDRVHDPRTDRHRLSPLVRQRQGHGPRRVPRCRHDRPARRPRHSQAPRNIPVPGQRRIWGPVHTRDEHRRCARLRSRPRLVAPLVRSANGSLRADRRGRDDQRGNAGTPCCACLNSRAHAQWLFAVDTDDRRDRRPPVTSPATRSTAADSRQTKTHPAGLQRHIQSVKGDLEHRASRPIRPGGFSASLHDRASLFPSYFLRKK